MHSSSRVGGAASQAGDPSSTGLCSQQHLLKMLLLHFNVLLTPGEQDCLKAEWQVMDHLTGEVGLWGLEVPVQGSLSHSIPCARSSRAENADQYCSQPDPRC